MDPDQYSDDFRTNRIRLGGSKVKGRISKLGKKRYFVSKRRLRILLLGLLLIGLIAGVSSKFFITGTVPQKIKASVPFSVYYPKDLPTGYALDSESFRLAEPGVVLFALSHGRGKDIVFSEVKQPSGSDMDKFISSYIPLNTVQQVPLGEARIGAYGSAPNIRTAVSLPVHDGPWIIMTAPSDVSHNELIRIVQSLTK
jgi:hypothetical protein